MPEHSPLTLEEVAKLLAEDGWTVKRRGPGGHVQYVQAAKLGKVTLDTGVREVPAGTLRSIYRQAGWTW